MVKIATMAKVLAFNAICARCSEVESSICTDGSGYTCDEVCCFNGATLEFCCTYDHPVCDAVHQECWTGDGSNDFMQAIAPVKKAEPKVEQPEPQPAELEVESTICTDGSGYTCEEVCCFNGATLEFCCTYDHPVCDAVHQECWTGDGSNDFMQAIAPVKKAEPKVEQLEPQPAELEVESTICTDGSGYTCEEVCCFNGATLEFCCTYDHPVCDAVHQECWTGDGSNDFMQAIAPVKKAEPETPKVEQPEPQAAELEVESTICTDGSGYTCEEVCCFNGATLEFCCTYDHPVCDAVHQECWTGDGSNDFMKGMAPVSSMAVV